MRVDERARPLRQQFLGDFDAEAEAFRTITGAGNDSHVTQVLYGGGPALVNSAGVPWTAAYIDTIGEPTADLRSNIAVIERFTPRRVAIEPVADGFTVTMANSAQ